MKFKKAIALGLSAVMVAGMMAGCGSSGGSEGTQAAGGSEAGGGSGEQIELTVSMWDYSNTAYYKNMIAAYEESHPNIKINVVEIAANEYDDVIVTRLGSKEKYDVVLTKGLPALSALINAGHLKPIDDYLENEDSLDVKNYKGLDEQLQVDGKRYALPFRSDNNLIYYNKDLFDAAGVDYPEDGMTLEEYGELARKMTSGEGSEKVYGTHVHTWRSNIYMYARLLGDEEFVDGNTATYENLKPYYELFMGLQNDGIVQDYGMLKSSNISYSGVFYNQQAAMLQIGTWYINMLMENVKSPEEDPDNGFNWGVCSLPTIDGSVPDAMVGGVTPIGIGAYAEHPDEAWDFIAWVCGDDGATLLAENGIVPGYISQAVLDTFDAIPETYKNAPEGMSKYLDKSSYIVEQPMHENGKALAKALDDVDSLIRTNSCTIDEGIQQMIEMGKANGAQ